MNLLQLFFTQDKSSYNLTMILSYIIVSLCALAICMMISNKLEMYEPKVHKIVNESIHKKINRTIHIENASKKIDLEQNYNL